MKIAAMTKKVYLAAAALTLMAIAPASAVQFTITANDVCTDVSCGTTGNSFIGPGGASGSSTDVRGRVNDGGFDAFDGMGYLNNLGVLTATRRTETFAAQNIYRWVDTITNSTGGAVTQTISWNGNLGSDGSQTQTSTNAFSTVNYDGFSGPSSDPVVAYVWGNNAFASTSMAKTPGFTSVRCPGCGDEIEVKTTLTLAAGQSISLMYFTYLTRDLTNRSGDIALAISGRDALLANPLLTGLSAFEISQIANWGAASSAPAPAALALVGLGLFGMGALRRRKA